MKSLGTRLTFGLPQLAIGIALSAGTALADGLEEPIPSYYEETGIAPNRQYVNQHPAEHIDPFAGKLQWHFTDLFIPGNGGLDLAVQRSYTSLPEFNLGSLSPEPSPAGIGWTMHFGRVMRTANVSFCETGRIPEQNPVLELGDGSRQILYDSLDGMSHISTQFWRAECNLTAGGGGLIVYSPGGTRYDMTTPGAPLGSAPHPVNTYYTTKITDRNGNSMDFAYQFIGATFAVSSITGSDGRNVTFTYNGNTLASVSDGTRTWQYVTVGGYLTEVQRPDGASWKFEYNPIDSGAAGAGSISKVTYPTGGVINYSYDFVNFTTLPYYPRSVVIKQKVADGGTWNYNYQPAVTPLPSNVEQWTYGDFTDQTVDTTTVSGPDGTRVFKHIGITSAPSGGVAHIGTNIWTILGTTQAERNGHCLELISWQANKRPGNSLIFDPDTRASVLTAKLTDRNGKDFGFTYEIGQYGNPYHVVEQGNATRDTQITYAVNTGKWILHQKKDETINVTTPDGVTQGQILRNIDAGNGNVLSESKFGVLTTYTYTSEGDLLTKTDARNNTITYGAYRRGIPQSESHPEGVSISRDVSGAGNVMSETDGENATTSWQYDALNRPIQITHPAGDQVNIAWQTNKRTLTRGNYTEEVTYDGFGRDTKVVHTDGSTGEALTVNNRFDILGRKVFSSYPNNSRGTSYLYDIVGQLQQVGFAVDPATGGGQAWRTYNLYGDQIQYLNERGYWYIQKYRGYSDPDKLELMSVDAPDPAASIAMKRNGLGQLLEVAQGGKTRSFAYDSRFFLTSQTDPETGTTAYGRDEVGNMTSKQVGAAAATSFAYDGRNRLKTTTYGDGKSSVRTYYKDDKLKSLSNDVAVRNYVYDGNKNMLSESLGVGTQTFTIQYGYNGNDALQSMTYGTGPTINYNPDGFGRPTQVSPYVTQVTHHPSGVVSSMRYANGVQTTMGVNVRQWPSTLKIAKTTDLVNREYFYDPAGNISAIDDLSANRQMGYDPLDRLTSATGPWAGTYEASYDGRGNITRQRWVTNGTEYLTRNYTYDATTDLLLNVTELNGAVTTPYNYTHDGKGNVTAKGGLNFAYTDASTMRCSSCGTTDETLYDYDGANMRVRTQKNGASTYFVYGAGGNLLWEQTPGSSYKHYFYLGGKQIATHEKPLAP